MKPKSDPKPTTPVKDGGNVTVTLTLTSSAAENIMGVLRDLANILHIPAPTSYQIVERTTTPPSQKLGLYRTKGRDGKEGGNENFFRLLLSNKIYFHFSANRYSKYIKWSCEIL